MPDSRLLHGAVHWPERHMRIELAKGYQHKGPHVRPRMRQCQIWRDKNCLVKRDQIQIECSGGIVVGSGATKPQFDIKKMFQQGPRIMMGGQAGHSVAEIGALRIHRRGAKES